ncbi:MAG: right-handed parallel beta-helix repeat-containing protein [Candidatus Bipolaricaulota bacterium]|nr:right-handed parallel beta-helix repeat-containing protein [Candidatus Bipolaricaulota bacterium]
MSRRCFFAVVLFVLMGAFGCTTVGPSVVLSGLPSTIVHGGTYTLTLTGSPGSSTGLWTYTLSSSCGGTFTLISPPSLPTSGNLVIGPTNAPTVQVSFTPSNPTADLSVTKSDNPDPVGVGYLLSYTLTVTNTGGCTITAKLTTASGRQATVSQNAGVNAANVVLTDTLPTTVTFNSASTGCTHSSGTVTCNLGTVNSNSSTSVTIQVTPQAAAVPSITNTASVTGAVTDPNPANNSDSENTTVTPVADLSVTKSDSPDPVNATQNITYTLTVTNNGPSPATNVVLTDTLPSSVTFVSVTPGTPTCAHSAGTVTCNLGSLANGGSATVTIVVTTTGASVPSVSNTVSVSAAEFDPTPANNTATVSTTVNPAADLSVTKSDTPDPVNVGDNLTYTITVTNNGPNNATGITVTDTLPATVTFVSASTGCTHSAGTVTCTIASLAASANTSVTITVTPQAGAVPSITNTVSVSGNEFDPNAANNSANQSTTVNPTADLSVTKGGSSSSIQYGQNVTYTITVTNNGPNNATGVTMTDTLPSGLVLVSATPSQGSCTGTTTITCNLGAINNGNNATVTIVAKAQTTGIDLVVDDDTAACAYTGTVNNPASATANEHDPNTANNSASASTTITANYATIGAAITAASPGNTIFVCPGMYNENPNVNKALTITGAGAASTTINGTAAGNVVTISSSNVTIQGFTITAPASTSNRYGIALATSALNTITIANTVIQNLVTTATFSVGISIHALNTNVTVTNNQITNIASGVLAYGILVYGSGGSGTNNITIQNNQVSAIQGQTQAGIGISVNDTAGNVTVSGNTVSNLTSPAAGVRVVGIGTGGTAGTPNNITIQNNTVSNLTYTGANIQDAVGIGVADTAQNVTIQNNTVQNCGVGIGLNTTGTNIQIVSGNDILNNQVGIGIASAPQVGWKANNNNIVGNVILGVNNLTATLFDAENNWWGCAAGPGNAGCDGVSANVDFTPWLAAPVP